VAAGENGVEMVSSVIGQERITENNVRGGMGSAPRGDRLSAGEDFSFDKPAVASLAIGTISEMSREELIRVIHGADLPLINNRNRHRLQYLDQASLQRLAQLARRCCRNQGY
jgi:hypothetical protein